MAIDAVFYKFSKKKNSTARPSGGTTIAIELKANVDVLNPTILLNVVGYPDYNYCYIAEFDRYYFVGAITWDMGNWSMTLEVDPLASWKSTIGSHTLYVTRSAVSSNGEIKDEAYPTKSDIHQVITNANESSPWDVSDLADGTFIVGIIGTAVTYYAMTPAVWSLLLTGMYSDDYLESLVGNDWATAFQDLKSRVNPLQYITSLMWLPFQFHTATSQTVKVGYVDITNVPCEKLDDTQLEFFNLTFTTPDHPQIARGSYLNSAPYSNYQLSIPPFGVIELDADRVANSFAGDVSARLNVDVRTGTSTMTVGNSVGTLARVSAKIGVSYQVSQVTNSGVGMSSMMNSAIGIGAGAMAGGVVGAIGASVVGGANLIGEAFKGRIPTASVMGSLGGVDSLKGSPHLYTQHYEIVDEDIGNKGRPLCELRTISGLSGYMVVTPANVSIPAQASELDSIKKFMEGGFYYE